MYGRVTNFIRKMFSSFIKGETTLRENLLIQ